MECSITRARALWRFFKEYRVFNDSFLCYLWMICKRNIEVIPLRQQLPDSKMRVIYGGFIIKHGKKETFIKHMVFLLGSHNDNYNLFKQVVGKIESSIFMKNPHTIITYDVKIEDEHTVNALLDLGYKKLRVYYSNYKFRLVKSKIMS